MSAEWLRAYALELTKSSARREGYASNNSCSVAPSRRACSRSQTGMRVRTMQGSPPQTSGWESIPGKSSPRFWTTHLRVAPSHHVKAWVGVPRNRGVSPYGFLLLSLIQSKLLLCSEKERHLFRHRTLHSACLLWREIIRACDSGSIRNSKIHAVFGPRKSNGGSS